LFDSNLDAQDPSSSLLTDCFAEQILRIDNAGPMAVIAPTRISYNIRATGLMKGIANVFWPGLVTVAYPEGVVQPLCNLGIALYLGKYYVENSVVEDEYDIEYHKGVTTNLIYHLFGDPETPLWTQSPEPLQVEHPGLLCFGESMPVTVTVRDNLGETVEGATVCLYKEGEVYEIQTTNGDGLATFNIEPSSCGELQITVTKQNYKPYISEIPICSILCIIGQIVIIIWPIIIIVGAIIIVIIIKKKK
jgi:hypothetical protein